MPLGRTLAARSLRSAGGNGKTDTQKVFYIGG